MESKRGKMEFLIHPNFESTSDFHADFDSPEKVGRLKSEREMVLRWKERVLKLEKNPQKILVIFSSSTSEQQLDGGAIDREIINFAKEKLGSRCVVLPKSSEYSSLYQDTENHAGQLLEELKKNGFIKNDEDVKDFSSVAFGEWSEACVMSVSSQINEKLGLNKETRLLTKDSLGIGGVNDKTVNSNTKHVLNQMRKRGLRGVVVKE